MPRQVLFPDNFVWGTATASYQVEGATDEGGRGDSIWDAFARTPGKVKNGETGAKGVDHYHRYKEDVQLMKQMGLKHYRLSIAWPRIIPSGIGPVNEEGVAFYNNLIDELLANDIKPLVTLYHWDLPLALQTEYDGWLGGEIIQQAFVQYARVCFERFGDRVKMWLTLNEPWCISVLGYGVGVHAPGRKLKGHIEAYQCGHNLLLSHAKTVDMYRRDFQQTQQGLISLSLNCDFREPAPSTDEDQLATNQEACQRSLLFQLGWFGDPVFFGDYPQVMKSRCGNRLPSFTEEEKKLLKGSVDYFALNHYGSAYTAPSKAYMNNEPPPNDNTGGWEADEGVYLLTNGGIWKKPIMGWNCVPWGLQKLLLWIQKRYQPVNGIYVTENGTAWPDRTRAEAQEDDFRVDYFRDYIHCMRKAIDAGADVRGYFAWSFCDNYEWELGYGTRFGLHWIDYDTMERVPKKSAYFFADCVRNNGFTVSISGF